MREAVRAAGYVLFGLTPEHIIMYDDLPRTHADPFDRLLARQGLADSLRLLTHDAAVASYSSSFILV